MHLFLNRFSPAVICVAVLCGPQSISAQGSDWESVCDGLELGHFKASKATSSGDSIVSVLRINPNKFELRLMAISETGDERGSTAKQWCEKYDLIAAINAGMYAQDHSTHIGYMRSGDHVNNAKVVERDYRSAAAFQPLKSDLPPFKMFDLDEECMDTVLAYYGSVIQNIRLIKRPRENRWPEKPEKWSEAALGEDRQGNVLFIFCRSPYTMYDFNEILLSLPVDLVCAQHLEGGPEAQLYLKTAETEINLFGGYESGFLEAGGNLGPWPVPNVIGIAAKTE